MIEKICTLIAVGTVVGVVGKLTELAIAHRKEIGAAAYKTGQKTGQAVFKCLPKKKVKSEKASDTDNTTS